MTSAPLRLSDATRHRLPSSVESPAYDRKAQKSGIIHIGIGAFHRAHQATFFDDCMNAGERDWAITGISLRSPSVAAQLNPQDGLYTVATRNGDDASYRLIGSVRGVIVAAESWERAAGALCSSDTRLVTLTITEKGYCRGPDGRLGFDLAGPGSVYSLLRDGLAARRVAGMPGLTIISCDNLANNGAQLAALLDDYLRRTDPHLADWVTANCAFPSSMVDRIVPATTQDDLHLAEAELDLRDEGHVVTEPFTQWVIEDCFVGPRPMLENHGVQLVADIAPYESAKLRMLNGAHSALAYIGLARGHTYVHEAVADPSIAPLIRQLMVEEAAPSIKTAPGMNLNAYAADLMTRFANSALNHRLSQIAMDGSQKIPNRWLPTLAWSQRHGSRCPAVMTGLAAWLLHVRGDQRPVEDPLQGTLAAAWATHGQDGILAALFQTHGPLASEWTPTAADASDIAALVTELAAGPLQAR